jgi:hypothetical protein
VCRIVLKLEVSDLVISYFTAGTIRTGKEPLVIDTEGKQYFYNPANHGAEERAPPPTTTVTAIVTATAAPAEPATKEGEPDPNSLDDVPPELLASAIEALQSGAFRVHSLYVDPRLNEWMNRCDAQS